VLGETVGILRGSENGRGESEISQEALIGPRNFRCREELEMVERGGDARPWRRQGWRMEIERGSTKRRW
jgi:hypothetical protein